MRIFKFGLGFGVGMFGLGILAALRTDGFGGLYYAIYFFALAGFNIAVSIRND